MKQAFYILAIIFGGFGLRGEPALQTRLTNSSQLALGVSEAGGKRFQLQYRTGLGPEVPWINVDGSHSDEGGTNWFLLSARAGLHQFFRVRTDAPENNGSSVFDESRVAVIKFTVSATNYTILTNITGGTSGGLNNDGDYVPAEMEFDGTQVKDVGLRRKGNSSAVRTGSDDPNYIPFKVDFDRYVDGQRFKGLSKLNLHLASSGSGGSGLEDYLGYGAWRDYGYPSPRTGWAEVWLNGEKVGLYTTVEQVDAQFLKRWFDYTKGNLYKPESPAGTLEWRGVNFQSYTNAAFDRGNDTNHTAFLRFVDVINHHEAAEFAQAMDVEGVLTYLAGTIGIGAWDNYSTLSHNYYLYEAVPGRITMLPWDMNDSMSAGTNIWQSSTLGGGGIGGGGFGTNGIPGGGGFPTNGIPGDGGIGFGTNGIPGGLSGGSHPLSEKLLATNSPYRGLYLTILNAFLTQSASKETLGYRIDAAQLVLSNRLETTRLLTLRSNIATRVSGLSLQLRTVQAVATRDEIR